MANIFEKLTSLGKESTFSRLKEIVAHDEKQQFAKLEKLPREELHKDKVFPELAKVAAIEKARPVSYEELLTATHRRIEPGNDIVKQILSATEKAEVRNDVIAGINDLQKKEKITRHDIIAFISLLPKKERIDVHATMILLAYLLKHGKVTKEDAQSIIVDLEKKNVLLAEDVADILFYLHLK